MPVLRKILLSIAILPAFLPAAPAKDWSVAAAEALVARLPQEKLYRAAGFFGPVVKKYLPTVQAFQRAYAEAPDKMAVIVRYAPKVDQALADAKAMKVPPRYEAEKAEYIRLAEAFAASLRLLVALKR
jgi:hypothetical protein